MPVKPNKKSVSLTGVCTAEDAEALQAWLGANPAGTVGLGKCDSLHTACLQVLMAAGRRTTGQPTDPALARIVSAALTPRA
ncbi:hypothetical protein F1188_19015 [Roseospira marina]|uniref:Uncharacterized protein n=1 Tax=Roseospira marina TaxID=140057 RepID=A0A5M6I6D6_9PROT|nr:hypothetical protein [Roseospira marina]KAA5603811.1 hypothetical protein F1188_19015 [Roseospira marina]MBB4316022.1 hypothetical protein [Roseospira marina]MBB5089188.1 hypothetical protein [Roseospira marina]